MKKTYLIGLLIMAMISCSKNDPAQPGNLVAKTVDENSALPSVTLSSTKLFCQTYGNPNGTKVFVLEGGPGDDFRYMLTLNQRVNGWSLTDNYQVIYHDYRGCGLSRRHPMNELTMAHSLKDLEELINHFTKPEEKVVLIGHSHGGKVAAQYLNKNINKVKGVVFIEPGSFTSEIVKKTPSATNINYFGSDVNKLLWVKQLIGMNNHAQADYIYDLAKINIANADRGETCPTKSYRSGTAALISIAIDEVENGTYDFTTNLKNFHTKALFISSQQTKDIGYDFQEKYHVGFFKNREHVKINNTGHDGLITCRANETLTYIKDYLAKL